MNIDLINAQKQLPELVKKAQAGETVIITSDDADILLMPQNPGKKSAFPFGIAKGMKIIDWDEPLPDEIAKPFGNID